MAKGAGKGLGEMQEVPKGFVEGFESSTTSEETKKMVRGIGKTTIALKDTATDLAGDYKEVAKEFAAGLKAGAQEVNKDVVGGLQQTNKFVSDTRSGVKDILGVSDSDSMKKS